MGFGSTPYGASAGELFPSFDLIEHLGQESVRVVVGAPTFFPISPTLENDPLNPASWSLVSFDEGLPRVVDRVSFVSETEVILRLNAGLIRGTYRVTFLPGFGAGYEVDGWFEAIETPREGYKADYASEGVDRLIRQYRGKPRIEGMIKAFLLGVQQVEDAKQAMAEQTTIDNVIGWALTQEAQAHNVNTENKTSFEIRQLIRVAKRSRNDNSLNAIIEIVAQIAGAELSDVQIRTGDASIVVVLSEPVISPLYLLEAVIRARAGGVRVWVEYSTAVPSHTFQFSSSASVEISTTAGLNQGFFAGVITE